MSTATRPRATALGTAQRRGSASDSTTARTATWSTRSGPNVFDAGAPFLSPPVPSEETRVGVVVKSCANHSQCFPTEAQALKGGIVLPQGGMTEAIKRDPFVYSVRGFQVETTCCTNGPNYRNDRNLPCNGAAALAPRLAALLLAAAALLFA